MSEDEPQQCRRNRKVKGHFFLQPLQPTGGPGAPAVQLGSNRLRKAAASPVPRSSSGASLWSLSAAATGVSEPTPNTLPSPGMPTGEVWMTHVELQFPTYSSGSELHINSDGDAVTCVS
jgi:hypothetical protein